MQDINPGLQEDARSHFLNYLQLIWFRRRFVLITTVIVTALGALWLTQQPPVHVSTSSLRIGLTESQEAGGESSSARGAIDEIAGEVEVLKSRKLASVLITQFQLQLYPELNPAEDLSSGFPESTWHHVTGWFRGLGRSEDATTNQEMADSPVPPVVIDRFLKRLTVERVGQSRVVRITFASHDPNLAARVANALPEAYMAARQQARIQASSSEADFAAEQFIELQERLAASERAEAYYRGTLDNIEAASMDELEQQMSELNSRLLIVKARRDQALNRLALVETLTAGGDISEEDQEILASPRIERLLEQRALLNENVAGLAAGDPETAQTSDDIAAANAAIRSELDRLVIEIQDEAVAASEESIGLESQIAELTIASSSQHRRLLQLKELEKETAINRLRFEAAAERIRQSSLDAELVSPDTELISAAAVSTTPIYPGRTRSLLYWGLAGFVLGLLLVLLKQARNPGMLSPEHVHFLLGESTIGVIPEVRGNNAPHELILDDAGSDFAAAVSALKITLDLADIDEPTRSIQLVSSSPGEGRAALAVALARVVAGEGQKVLLVSAHLRHSTIEEKLGVQAGSPGLTDLILSEQQDLDAFLQQDHRSAVQVLSAGTAEYANPDVVFSSQRMHSLVEQMKEKFDFIVFDTPPVMSTADAIAIGKLVDKTLFVVRWNKTPKALVASSLNQMRAGGLDIAGVVLQHVNLQRYGAIEFSDFGYLYHQVR